MRQTLLAIVIVVFFGAITTGCAQDKQKKQSNENVSVGIMLSDVGLGDQSFSDAAFQGLIKLRDEENIQFDYRELEESGTYENGIEDLVKSGNELVIGLGFMVQEDLEKVATKYPDTQFLLIDAKSDLPNVTSITFKEEEGSYLVGAVAALATKSNKIGFLGGDDVPLIRKFEKGFVQGAKAINPTIKIDIRFAGDFGDDKLGERMARDMITNGSDVLYSAAGLTGVGALKEAQKSGVYSIGVDSDQFFYAEKSVITSMMKYIDKALYRSIKEYFEQGEFTSNHIELGIKEDGVGLAPIRVISFPQQKNDLIEKIQADFSSGKLAIN